MRIVVRAGFIVASAFTLATAGAGRVQAQAADSASAKLGAIKYTLRDVGKAEAAYKREHGAFTDSLSLLGVRPGAQTIAVTITLVGSTGYRVEARRSDLPAWYCHAGVGRTDTMSDGKPFPDGVIFCTQ